MKTDCAVAILESDVKPKREGETMFLAEEMTKLPDSGDAKTENNQGDNEDVFENVDDILRNLPSEQGLLKS